MCLWGSNAQVRNWLNGMEVKNIKEIIGAPQRWQEAGSAACEGVKRSAYRGLNFRAVSILSQWIQLYTALLCVFCVIWDTEFSQVCLVSVCTGLKNYLKSSWVKNQGIQQKQQGLWRRLCVTCVVLFIFLCVGVLAACFRYKWKWEQVQIVRLQFLFLYTKKKTGKKTIEKDRKVLLSYSSFCIH